MDVILHAEACSVHDEVTRMAKFYPNGGQSEVFALSECVLTDVLDSARVLSGRKRGILHKWGPRVGPARGPALAFTSHLQLTSDLQLIPCHSMARKSNGPNLFAIHVWLLTADICG